MILYNDTRAPNPRRVRIFLAEKNIQVERRDIDILENQHKEPEFTAINPLQRLPVLVLDDGTVIAETVAICRYLENLRPEPVLMGYDARDMALVEMWQRHVEFHLFWPASQACRHLIPALAIIETPQVQEWGKVNEARTHDAYRWLDDVLGKSEYVAGPAFSIADITAICAIDFAKFARITIAPELEHLSRWYDLISQRKSTNA